MDDDGDTLKDDGCPSGKYAYDALNRRESETDGLGRVTSYQYWEDSTPKQRTDARGLVTKYFPDAVQRPDVIEYWNGGQLTSSVDYAYDDVGNRLTMVDSTGTTSYQYDALNRLTSVTSPGPKTVTYRYDNTGAQGEDPAEYPGQRTKITYPDSKAAVYTYESDGSMKTVTDWLSKTTTYNYDNASRLTSATLGNGLITDYTYDDAARLLTLVNRDGGATISSYGYTLDKVGNRTQVVDTSGTTAFSYDALYRLTGADYPGTADDTTYSYDAMGNRLTQVKNGTPTSYTYDDADEMLTAGGVSYGYDNNGNQTGRASDTFGWDHEDRLTSTNIGGTAGSYAYNGDGLRMSRTLGGATVSYTWDVAGGLPVILQDSAGNSYVYGLDLISRTDSGGAQEYELADGLGSTTGIADGSKTVVATYQYDAFGAVRAQTGSSPNEFTFTGEQTDGSGLQYLRARYYDPTTGRFLGRDPVPYLQRYAYVFNNPVNLTDPSGMDARTRSLRAQLAETVRAGGNCVEASARLSLDEMQAACGDFLRLSEQLTEALLQATMEALEDGWEWTVDRTADMFWAYKDFVDQVVRFLSDIEHALEVIQTISGLVMMGACTEGLNPVCIGAAIVYVTVSGIEILSADTKHEMWIAGGTAIVGAIPGSGAAWKVIAGASDWALSEPTVAHAAHTPGSRSDILQYKRGGVIGGGN